VIGGWEIVSMEASINMTELAKLKPIVSEFITSKITDRKLNVDNYL